MFVTSITATGGKVPAGVREMAGNFAVLGHVCKLLHISQALLSQANVHCSDSDFAGFRRSYENVVGATLRLQSITRRCC